MIAIVIEAAHAKEMKMERMLPARLSTSHRITDVVMEWPGVRPEIGSHGKLAFKVGNREIGHLHGNTAAHFVFDRSRWAELMAAERVVEHPFFPGRVGPAARPITGDEDMLEVIALLRINYDARIADCSVKRA